MIDTKSWIKEKWDNLQPLNKRDFYEKFLSKLTPFTPYYDYYSGLSIDRIINDSVFKDFLKDEMKIEISLERRRENLNYHPIDNLKCEPQELELARIREISGAK